MKKIIIYFLMLFISFANTICQDRLLIKIPTRSRPQQFFSRLNEYYHKLSGNVHCTFLITCDVDDPTMNNSNIITHLKKYPNLYIYFGTHKSKVEAYNRDIDKHLDFDALLVASDDMLPIVHSYDAIIMQRMKESFPDFDGVLNFNDGHHAERVLNTMPVLGKKYYERFGYIYHPAYMSLSCDDELTSVSKILGKERVCNEIIIEHKHPYWGTARYDELYRHNDQFAGRDLALYQQRKARNFDLHLLKKPESTQVKWSILIPTLRARKHLLQRVHSKITNQIKQAGLEGKIEILLFEDNREHTVGYKRNWLLGQAKGEYVCFLDDDDDVSDDYIPLIYNKLLTNPDCVALEGIITFDGKDPRRFTHSIQYHEWFFKDGIYYRPPNHLNPVKRSIAIQFKFPEINSGEDKAWSMAIEKSGLLKTEASVDKPYYYYLYITNK